MRAKHVLPLPGTSAEPGARRRGAQVFISSCSGHADEAVQVVAGDLLLVRDVGHCAVGGDAGRREPNSTHGKARQVAGVGRAANGADCRRDLVLARPRRE